MEAQARLIQALLDPARYPHPVDRVERIDTHISTVLLAGDFAYKFKKPLNPGFLDFTTLARRAHFCAEELRLNRRLAPELYLERVAVTGTAEAPRLGGEGPAIEYAVRMRRFPQEALLSRRLSTSGLPLELMDQLAGLLVDFHAEAAVAAPDSDFGLPDQVARPLRETLEDLADLVAPDDRAGLAALDRHVASSLGALASVFQARREAGRVRECHGDLHLDNLILWNQRLLAFDGIEFDPQLRWIDVMNDLAFTLMDLDFRRSPVHARRLKSAYLEASGDYPGLAVLRFYQLYRALVRAKIAGLRARQLPPGEREAQEAGLADHLALARAYAQPRRPRLVITGGLSGSGKSTLAQALVEARGFVRIRSDVERKRLFGLPPLARSDSALDQGLYTPEASARTYDRLAELARRALEAGEAVVVDAAFLEGAQRTPFQALARSLGLELELLWAEAPPAVLEARLRARQAQASDPSEAGLAVLARQRVLVEPPRAEEGRRVLLTTDDCGWRQRLIEQFT